MKNKYFEELNSLLSKIEVDDEKGRNLALDEAVDKIISMIEKIKVSKNKIIFIGNGGSASIANHMITDFIKNAEIPAISFSDSSLLTCLSNDLGYEHVFQKPIEVISQKGDILFSISSSGQSKNIINATKEARKQGCLIVTLSGFKDNNPLRKLGDFNFYVTSDSYGYVEIIHLIICHLIVEKSYEV